MKLIKAIHNLRKTLLLLPPYVWFIVLLLTPLLIIFAISISEYDPTILPPFKPFLHKDSNNKWTIDISFESFKLLFGDRFYLRSYLTSLKLAAITTICTLLIGYPIALGIVSMQQRFKILLLLAIMLPFWTSLVIRVYAWSIMLGDVGIINKFLLKTGLVHTPIQFLNSQFAVVLGMTYCYLPFMVLPLFIAIDRIDKSIIEASLDLGCNPFTSFLRVVLPLSKSGIIAGSMLVFIPAIGEVIIPDLLGGNKVLTVGRVIWNEFFSNRDWPTASAITVILISTFVIPIIAIQNVIINRASKDAE